jgi:hypothetical protein
MISDIIMQFFYNDLLFEIYHYIPQTELSCLNKTCKKLIGINERIQRYVYHIRYPHRIKTKYIEKYGDRDNMFLVMSCKYGDVKRISEIIKRGANCWDRCLYQLCISDPINIKLIKLIIRISKIDPTTYHAIYKCIAYTLSKGDIKVAKYFMKYVDKNLLDWRHIFYSICKRLNVNSLGYSKYKANISKYKHIMKYCMKHLITIKDKPISWRSLLASACYSGNREYVSYIIEKGGDNFKYEHRTNRGMIRPMNIMFGFTNACKGGNIDIVNDFIGYADDTWLNRGFGGTCFGLKFAAPSAFKKYRAIMQLMIDKGAIHCSRCNKSFADHLLKK